MAFPQNRFNIRISTNQLFFLQHKKPAVCIATDATKAIRAVKVKRQGHRTKPQNLPTTELFVRGLGFFQRTCS